MTRLWFQQTKKPAQASVPLNASGCIKIVRNFCKNVNKKKMIQGSVHGLAASV